MKLAMICTERLPVPPLRGGAIQIFMNGVAPYLAAKHALTIYCIDDPELPDRETVHGVRYIRVPREDYELQVAKQLALEEVPYDLIHVCNRPKHLLLYKHAMPSSRFVVSLHNEMFKEAKISRQIGELAIQIADGIMTVSDYIGRTITDRLPSAKPKISTVYSGIDLDIYRPIWDANVQPLRSALRQQFGVDHNKVVLFVGRLSKVKGPDVLIQAMEQVIHKHSDAVLVIVGSRWFSDDRMDEYTLKLRHLAEALGENRVVFTNFVAPSQIPEHFLLGDLFVCCSQWEEPLARVHYEAMGAGLPIVTTRRGGNPEIFDHMVNGIVIDDFTNPQAFAEAINYLFDHAEEASRLAQAGRATAEANYGFQHVAQRLEQLYEQAISSS
ncbi:glycosyltransferase family 4 protein [Paenibacillus aestuarii]|uniref:Glycosyltransferase family 4 protein n=1 Tax=Paenibacillus aestuarii TaxID=516965 RepID=A0ABW0KDP1_9BACL|nr:glycosyltransferase family 4 protein [Paenibacillus aestuarii]